MGLIFRVDDVSVNTDIRTLLRMANSLEKEFPGSEMWWCINIFCKTAPSGSVYPDLPLRGRDKEYFAEVDRMLPITHIRNGYVKFVSHGLFHADHGQLSFDAQLFSIVSSCRILKTDIFVPPFTNWNSETERVCSQNKIRLVRGREEGWKSLESEPFDPAHDKWFFHAWRFTFDSFKEKFIASKVS